MFEIFHEDEGHRRAADMVEILAWMEHAVDEHHADPDEVVQVMIDLLRPGTSENSHDVKPIWSGAMWALGYGAVAEQVAALWLNTMPWGLGFAISVEKDFRFEALSDDAKHAVIRSLCAVIQMGGLKADITTEGTIRVEGMDDEISTEHLVGQFRHEIERELGPDAPDKDNPMRRWGL